MPIKILERKSVVHSLYYVILIMENSNCYAIVLRFCQYFWENVDFIIFMWNAYSPLSKESVALI